MVILDETEDAQVAPPARRTALPERIRRARIERGLTQREVAQLIASTVQTVSGWERGKTIPRVHRLEALAAALGQAPGWFLATARDQMSRRRAERLAPVAQRIAGAMRELTGGPN